MTPRVDDNGAAHKGSQLQTQLYVNHRVEQLDTAIRGAFEDLRDARIEWRSPLASESYREYWDGAFLQALDLDEHQQALRRFWPARGPHWDALALIHREDVTRPGVLLVEGKSYPAELYSGGSAATAEASRILINDSLLWTQQQIGVKGAPDWTGSLYQDANRLAHLYWLNSIGVETWLVHLLFTADDHHEATSEERWRTAIELASADLGIAGLALARAGHVMLPAGTRAELTTG
jgi:hypothetical protein